MKRWAAVLSLLIITPARAQQGTTAELTGRVTSGGQALPGVTVTIDSSSLQGDHTTVTGENGGYRFTLLPPAEYRLRFELQGFSTAEKRVRLSLAEAIRGDIDLTPAPLRDEVVVESKKNEHVAADASIAMNLPEAFLQHLPGPRDIRAATLLSPNADAVGIRNGLVIAGAPSWDSLFLVDGVAAGEYLSGQPHDVVLEDAIQEVTVLAGAISAEYGRFTGGVVSTLTKSGGDEFSGSLRDTVTNAAWTARTPWPGQPAALNHGNHAIEGTFGGYLAKGRLWFFAASRNAQSTVGQFTSLTNLAYPRTADDQRWEGKVTGQIRRRHALIVSYLIAALRTRFPQMNQGQIGFFVGSTRLDYRPQIRLERQVYQGMQIASDAVRDAEQQRKKQLTRELRDIIRRKRVTTLFQPIIRAREQTIFGYEVLTRGPAGSSFRNSDMLFQFARDAKLAWALETIALEVALKRLRDMDLGDRKFLLNLEAEMFEESEFRIHEMVSFFAEHQGNFVFELTERAAIEDYNVFRGFLDEFRAKGIEVAIDDAGSGYASLEAIASLSPDYLKVTKGLVSTLAAEPIKQDLVRMLVDLAGKIGAKTIAEGIETVEEFETCRALGIDLIQGYYVAHPHEHLTEGDAEVAASLSAHEKMTPTASQLALKSS